MFADEDLHEHRAERDPVAAAKPAAEVKAKKTDRLTDGGNELQSFRTLLDELGTQCRNRCTFGQEFPAIDTTRVTDPTPFQSEAFRLLANYCSQPS